MSREPDAEGGPELGDGLPADQFDAIVSGWLHEGGVPQWPDEGRPDERPLGRHRPPEHDGSGPDRPPRLDEPEPPTPAAGTPRPDVPPPSTPGPVTREPGPAELAAFADEHFIPPEPPPLPRPGPPALVGLALLSLGLVLVITPGWVGVPGLYGLPLGLVVLASGLAWLVLRLWPTEPADGDGPDDGAVI